MSSETPLVSVVIAARNAEPYIEQTLLSVLAQSYRAVEILLVDDASADRTAEIARRTAAGRTGLQLIRLAEGVGTAAAQNLAIASSAGKYVAFLDADDLWHADKLSRHVKHLELRPQVGVSYSYARLISSSGERLPCVQRPPLAHPSARKILLRHPVSNGSNAVFRRAALDEAALQLSPGLFQDVRAGSYYDVELSLRIRCCTTYEFEGIAEELTYYRLSAGSSAAAAEKCEDIEKLLECARRLDPELQKEEPAAWAYHLRFLARRAFAEGDFARSRSLIVEALRRSLHPAAEEPIRTLATVCAVLLCSALPTEAAARVRRLMFRRS